jgi:hypothetical protein
MLSNIHELRCFLWGQNNPEVNYSPTRISGGECFQGEYHATGKGWAGHVARMGEGRGVHRVLVGKPEEKRPLGRPRRRWEDNID